MPFGWLVALAGSPLALAQEPAPVMQFDRLLVAPVRAPDAQAADAERLYGLLEAELARSWSITAAADTPPFADYDAPTYLAACPPGQYAGCTLLVAQRAEVDWAIALELTPREGGGQLHVTFVDVGASQELFSVGLAVGAGRDAAVLRSVAGLLDRVVHGDFHQGDIRTLPAEDPAEKAQREAERRARVTASLEQLERELGDVEVGEVGVLDPPRLGRADLDRWRDAEGAAPWEQAGLREGAFLRYKNSGLDLETWRRRAAGRAGMVLLRAEAGVGPGAFSQTYQGWVALDDALAVGGTDARLEVTRGQSVTAGGELGLGVCSWLELSGGAWMTTGSFTATVDQDVEGDPVQLPGEPIRQPMTTARFGGGATFAPWPAASARPTLGVAVTTWTGKGFTPPDPRLSRFDAPTLTLLEPQLGGEVRASDHATVFARVAVSLPVGGQPVRSETVGGSTLPSPVLPGDGPGVGIQLRAGVQARLGPLWGRR